MICHTWAGEAVGFYALDFDAPVESFRELRAAASSLLAFRLAFLLSLRSLTASAHFLCSSLYFSSAQGEGGQQPGAGGGAAPGPK